MSSNPLSTQPKNNNNNSSSSATATAAAAATTSSSSVDEIHAYSTPEKNFPDSSNNNNSNVVNIDEEEEEASSPSDSLKNLSTGVKPFFGSHFLHLKGVKEEETDKIPNMIQQQQIDKLLKKTAFGGFEFFELRELKEHEQEQQEETESSKTNSQKQKSQENKNENEKDELVIDETTIKNNNNNSSSSPTRNTENQTVATTTTTTTDSCCNTLSWSLEEGFRFNCFQTRFQIKMLSIFIRISLLVITWLLLWLLLPQELLELQGVVFDPIICFIVCSIIGKGIGRIVGMPPLIIIFLAGLMWGNIPTFKFLASGISANLKKVVTRVGLSTILLRTGLAISPKLLAPAKWNIMAMSILPLLTEVVVHGFMAQAIIFTQDNTSGNNVIDDKNKALWPFLESMIVAPSASGVVAAVVMILQQQGYTVSRGPSVLLIPACALDMTLGIWGVNFVASLLTRDENASLAWPILKGPVQIIVGALCGIVLGYLWFAILLVFFAEGKKLPVSHVGATLPLPMSHHHHHQNNNASSSSKKRNNNNNNALTRKNSSSSRLHSAAAATIPKERYSAAFFHQVSFNATIVLGMFAMFTIFIGYYIEFAGGGCIACTMVGATAQYLITQEDHPPQQQQKQNKEEENKKVEQQETEKEEQEKEKKETEKKEKEEEEEESCFFSLCSILHSASPEEHKLLKPLLAANFAQLWDDWVMPALFSFSGASLDVRGMFGSNLFGQTLATIIVGWIARSVVTGLCAWSFPGLTLSEFIITCFTLGGKAFSQAALGGVGKEYVKNKLSAVNGNTTALASFDSDTQFGNQVADAGALSIVFISPIVVILLSNVGPCFWLKDADFFAQQQKEKEEEERKRKKENGEEGNDDDDEGEMQNFTQKDDDTSVGGTTEEVNEYT